MEGAASRIEPDRRTATFWEWIPLFWRFQIAGWLAYLVVSFPTRLTIYGALPEAITVSLVRDGCGFLFTLGMREIYRRVYQEGISAGRMVAIASIVSLIGGVLLAACSLAIFPINEDKFFQDVSPGVALFSVFYLRTWLCVCWSALYFGIRQMLDGMERRLKLAQIESEKRGAELQMLRSQMNPHFLFNALTTIRSGLISRDPELAAVVQNLADYLRFSLQHAGDSMVPVGDEFDAATNYLSVQKARFEGDLEFECQIDEEVRDTPTPGILLQPLVENAIKYGRRTSAIPLRVSIRVSADGNGSLSLRVANTGKWVESNADSTHIGIANLRRRLDLLYQGRYRFETDEQDPWVVVTLKIPRKP